MGRTILLSEPGLAAAAAVIAAAAVPRRIRPVSAVDPAAATSAAAKPLRGQAHKLTAFDPRHSIQDIRPKPIASKTIARELGMWTRHAIVLFGLLTGLCGFAAAASAQDFHIEEVNAARSVNAADIKPGAIVFSDHTGASAVDSET